MDISQENFLCIYLKQTKMSFVSFYKIGQQKRGTGSAWGRELVEGEEVRKGYGRVNMVQILCTQEWRKGRERRIVEGVNSTTIYLIHCKDFRK
jgi:hypothetical protein